MAALIQNKAPGKHDRAATEAIAKETDTSIDVVQQIYEEEFSSLQTDAKITQYLGVLASRRVRMKLSKH
jgi:hypothetical protein